LPAGATPVVKPQANPLFPHDDFTIFEDIFGFRSLSLQISLQPGFGQPA